MDGLIKSGVDFLSVVNSDFGIFSDKLSLPLGDTSLGYLGKEELKTSNILPAEETGVEKKLTVGFGASESIEITVFNQNILSGNIDTDRVIGTSDAISLTSENEIKSQIEYDSRYAWVKYSLVGNLRAAGGGNVLSQYIGANLEAGVKLKFDAYRIHKPTDILSTVLNQDFQYFKFAFNRGHIKSLEKNEALSMEFTGTLSGTMNIDWSDVLTSAIVKLPKILNTNVNLTIETSRSISFSVNWGISDDFRIIFSKLENNPNQYRIGLKKTKVKAETEAFSAGVITRISNVREIQPMLDNMIIALLGITPELYSILTTTTLERLVEETDLTPQVKGIIVGAMSKLGLDPTRNRIGQFKDLLELKIMYIISSEIQAGISFEYDRIETDNLILEAIVTENVLDRYHGELILSRFDNFINAIRHNESGIRLERFFHENQIEISTIIGFRFGIGNWAIGSREVNTLRYVERETLDQRKKISYMGTIGFQNYFGEKQSGQTFDFNAGMEQFSSTGVPMLKELHYGLSLTFTWDNPNSIDFEAIIDQAKLWKVVTNESVFKLYDEFQGRKINNAVCNLRFNPGAFELLIPMLIKPNNDLFCSSLAAALPWTRDCRSLNRNDLEKRRTAYTPLWKEMLANYYGKNRVIVESELANRVGGYFRYYSPAPDLELEYFERTMWPSHRTSAFAPIAHNQDPFLALKYFCDGMKIINDGFRSKSNAPHTEIQEVWHRIKDFLFVPLLMRALGDYMLALSNKSGSRDEIMKNIDGAINFSFDDNQEKMLAVSR